MTSRRNVLIGAGAAGVAMAAVTEPAAAATRDGRVVLITGATSGIGRATAIAFARNGDRVFFCGRRVALGQAVEREIRAAGGEATYMRADVRRESDVVALVAACVRTYGRLDVAFNNAGIETPRPAPLHEQSLADFENVWRTNTAGTFLSMKYELPHLLRTRGVIVNTASISAEVGFATIAPYNASKHGVASLTKVASLEYAGLGVRINALAPGAVDTPMLRRAAEAFGVTYKEIAADYPINRIVAPEEMATVVLFLASPAASAVHGTDLDASGGYLTG